MDPVLTLMATPQEIRPMSTQYLTVLFVGLPVVMAYNLLAGILRALGDGKSPLYAMVVASVLNVGLDILFVAGLGWGVSGAAVATVIAQFCSCIFCVSRLAKIGFIRPTRSDLHPDRRIALQLMRLGVPVAAQNGVIGVGGMIVQTIVNPLGVAFIAGYTATNKLYGVLEIAAISFGYAVSAYAGQNLGAGKIRRIRQGVHTAVLLGVAVSAVIGMLMILFGGKLTASFITGTAQEVAEATRIAAEYLFLMSACLPILYILHIYRSALQGMGNTVMPMASGFAEFVMRTGSALLLPALIGYQGVFWAEVLAWLGADCILVTSYYVQMHRMRKECA
jgi:putative MATE family efflux protein